MHNRTAAYIVKRFAFKRFVFNAITMSAAVWIGLQLVAPILSIYLISHYVFWHGSFILIK